MSIFPKRKNKQPNTFSLHAEEDFAGKFRFFVSTESNGNEEIRMDILKIDGPNDNNWIHSCWVQNVLTTMDIPLISIASIEVYGTRQFGGSIIINQDEVSYAAHDLTSRLWTRRIEHPPFLFYKELGPSEDAPDTKNDCYVCYYDRKFIMSKSKEDVANGIGLVVSYVLNHSKIVFYIDSEQIAEISAQIHPWNPHYEGWVLDSYKRSIPFLVVCLVADLFQCTDEYYW